MTKPSEPRGAPFWEGEPRAEPRNAAQGQSAEPGPARQRIQVQVLGGEVEMPGMPPGLPPRPSTGGRGSPTPTPPPPTKKPTVHGEFDWAVTRIDWSYVFGNQAWGTILLVLMPLALTNVALMDLDPADRFFDITDPSINRPQKSNTIEPWVGALAAFGLFLLPVLAGEFWMYRPCHGNISSVLYTTIHFIVGWGSAMSAGAITWMVSGVVVGRLRPDYASRCDPNDTGVCQIEPSDGRQSFFSGPSMWSSLSATFSTVYIIWLVFFRVKKEIESYDEPLSEDEAYSIWIQKCLIRQRTAGECIIERVVHEVGHSLAIWGILIQYAFSWALSTLVLIDNRSHPSDVNSGLIVGMLLGCLFGLNFIWIWEKNPKKPDKIVDSKKATERVMEYSSHARGINPEMTTSGNTMFKIADIIQQTDTDVEDQQTPPINSVNSGQSACKVSSADLVDGKPRHCEYPYPGSARHQGKIT